MSRDLVSESLFIPLELAAVLCLLNFRRSGGILAWAAATGVALGAAVLTRNTGFVLAIPVMVGLWLARPGFGARLLAPACALLVALLVVTPCLSATPPNSAASSRSRPAVGSPSPAPTTAPPTTTGRATGPGATPRSSPNSPTSSSNRDATRRKSTRSSATMPSPSPGNIRAMSSRPRAGTSCGCSRSRADRWSTKPARPSSTAASAARRRPPERIGLALAGLLALCGLVVLVRARLRSRRDGAPPNPPSGPLFLWLVPLVMLAAAIPIAGVPRYRLPADPFVLMLAAIGAAWLFDRLTPGRQAAT